jgi:tetratricopeptide (TPR) repeat protein
MIPACDEIIAARDKYLLDAMRIKGNALIMTNASTRPSSSTSAHCRCARCPGRNWGWRRRIRAVASMEQAKLALNDLLAETPRFLAAYDASAACTGNRRGRRGSAGSRPGLRDVPQLTGSPSCDCRHCRGAGRLRPRRESTAHRCSEDAQVALARPQRLRQLGNALTELGDTEKAIALITEAKTSFKEAGDTTLLAAVEAVAQHKAGHPELAQQALERAMQGDTQGLVGSGEAGRRQGLSGARQAGRGGADAQGCRPEQPGPAVLHASITQMMKTHGNAERAELISSSNAEIIRINDDAVRKGQSGDFRTAAAMLREAAERLPGNLQIVANAAYALFLDVYANGLDADKLRDAHRYHQMLLAKDQRHPRLGPIAALLAKIQRKFKLPVIS